MSSLLRRIENNQRRIDAMSKALSTWRQDRKPKSIAMDSIPVTFGQTGKPASFKSPVGLDSIKKQQGTAPGSFIPIELKE